MRDDNELSMKQIEQLEEKYLNKYWHFLKFVEDEIIKGFNSKNDIKSDWIGKYGNAEGGTSNFAVGSERIVYALINEKINYEIEKNVFYSRIIKLEDLQMKITKEKENYYIQLFDEKMFEEKIKLPIDTNIPKKSLDIKVNRKIKLFE